MRRLIVPLLAVLLAIAFLWRPAAGPDASPDTARRALPQGVPAVIERIGQGGPFPYRQDGAVFGNREGRLPPAARGYYHEYTVPTPGSADRGARRLVTGGNPPVAWYYTDDHYRSFRKLDPEAADP